MKKSKKIFRVFCYSFLIFSILLASFYLFARSYGKGIILKKLNETTKKNIKIETIEIQFFPFIAVNLIGVEWGHEIDKQDKEPLDYSFYSKNIKLKTSWTEVIKSIKSRVLNFEEVFFHQPILYLTPSGRKDFKDFDSTKIYINKFVKETFSYFNFRKFVLIEGNVIFPENKGTPYPKMIKKIELKVVRQSLNSKLISVNLKGDFVASKKQKDVIPFQISGEIKELLPGFNLFDSDLNLNIKLSNLRFCHIHPLFHKKFATPYLVKGKFDIVLNYKGKLEKEGRVSGSIDVAKLSFEKPNIFPLWPAYKRININYFLNYNNNVNKLSIEKLNLKTGNVNISLKGNILEIDNPSPIFDLDLALSNIYLDEFKKVFPFGLLPSSCQEFFLNQIKGGEFVEANLKFKGKLKGASKDELLRKLQFKTTIKDLEVAISDKFPKISIEEGEIKYKDGELSFFNKEGKILNSSFRIERGLVIKMLKNPLLNLEINGEILPFDLIALLSIFNTNESICKFLKKVKFSEKKLPLKFTYTGVLEKIFDNFKLEIDLNDLNFIHQNFPPIKDLKGVILVDRDSIEMNKIEGYCGSGKVFLIGKITRYRSKNFYYKANLKGEKLKIKEFAPYFKKHKNLNIGGILKLNFNISGRKGWSKENVDFNGEFALKGGSITSLTKEKAFLAINKLNMEVKISPSSYDCYGMGYLGNSLVEFKGSYKSKSSLVSLDLTSPNFDLNQIRPKKAKKRNYVAKKAYFIREMTGNYISLQRKYKFLQKSTLLFNFKAKEGKFREKKISDINLWIELKPNEIVLHEVSYIVHDGLFKEKGKALFGKDKLKKFSYEFNIRDLNISDMYKGKDKSSPLISSGNLSVIGTLNGNIKDNNIRDYLNGKLDLEIKDGNYNRIKYIGKILQIINFSEWGEKIINTSTPGIPFSDLTVNLSLKDSIASTSNLTLNSKIIRFFCVGKMDMAEEMLDLVMAIQPLVALDNMVSKVPIFGEVFTGDDKKLLVTYFEIKGSASNPQVKPIDNIKNLGEGIFGIFYRLLKLPVKIILKPLP